MHSFMKTLMNHMNLISLILLPLATCETISIPFNRLQKVKKRDVLDTSILNEGSHYVANIGVGTPPQQVQVAIDTGSSDLWITEDVFRASNSSSFENTFAPFYTTFLQGTAAEGTWASDSVTLGDTTLENVTLGYALSANISSILGIGPRGGEAPFYFPNQNGNITVPYDNVPSQLHDQGRIETVTYSLWLNDPSAASGSLLFGGIDTTKFFGRELTILPMYNFYGTTIPRDIRVILSSISLDSQLVAAFSYSASLDSGSTAISLPFPAAQALGQAINYTLDLDLGFYTGDCASSGAFNSLEFDFLGANISVPFSTLISTLYADDAETVPEYRDGEKQCWLGVAPAASPEDVILGDYLLRYMYVTFDLENYEVGIAQASFSASESNIQEITGRIPGSPAPRYAENIVTKGIQTYNVQPQPTSTTRVSGRCAA